MTPEEKISLHRARLDNLEMDLVRAKHELESVEQRIRNTKAVIERHHREARGIPMP